MGDKFIRNDFNYGGREKKKWSKWLFVGLIIVIVIAVKIISSDESFINQRVKTTSFELEIPKISSVKLADEKNEGEVVNKKQLQAETK